MTTLPPLPAIFAFAAIFEPASTTILSVALISIEPPPLVPFATVFEVVATVTLPPSKIILPP